MRPRSDHMRDTRELAHLFSLSLSHFHFFSVSSSFPPPHIHRGEAIWGHSKKTALWKPGRQSPHQNLSLLTLWSGPPSLQNWEITGWCCRRPWICDGSLSFLTNQVRTLNSFCCSYTQAANSVLLNMGPHEHITPLFSNIFLQPFLPRQTIQWIGSLACVPLSSRCINSALILSLILVVTVFPIHCGILLGMN